MPPTRAGSDPLVPRREAAPPPTDLARSGICIWLSADAPETLSDVGRELCALLGSHVGTVALLPGELFGRNGQGLIEISTVEQLTSSVARLTGFLVRLGVTVVVAAPDTGFAPGDEIRSRVGPMVDVFLRKDGRGRRVETPLPLIYRHVAAGRVIERAFAPSRTAPAHPDVVIDGAGAPPSEAASVILDALLRAGWVRSVGGRTGA